MTLPAHVPVLIVGGGPVGLTLAALLAHYGIASLTLEADDGYCDGSRAICISRRSQEILGWIGADAALNATGLPWTGGRSYYRDREVLHFEMPHDPLQRFAPMVNIQQYFVEEYAHQALQRQPGPAALHWSARAVGVRSTADGVQVDVDIAGHRHALRADWLVACDGGRSSVREALGLKLEGMQYEGRYVIVDIEQASHRPVERLAWFDPPSNPGSTLLMHRQPGNVWRVDYQIRDDEDAADAVAPGNVLPRVQSHLDMIGETAPWKPLWISLYNAKCLTLERYRHGRVLFAGDAAHLVPIFGVRGLNSGLDDAGNLAWKLAWVLRGQAPDSLLDSYSDERVHATRQNLAYGAKSTEFMAPPRLRLSADARGRAAAGLERRAGAAADQSAPVRPHLLRGLAAEPGGRCRRAAPGRRARPAGSRSAPGRCRRRATLPQRLFRPGLRAAGLRAGCGDGRWPAKAGRRHPPGALPAGHDRGGRARAGRLERSARASARPLWRATRHGLAAAPGRLRDGPLGHARRNGPARRTGALLPHARIVPPGDTTMNDDQLDQVYTRMAQALTRVGEARAPLFLSILGLSALARLPDAQAACALLAQAEAACAAPVANYPAATADSPT